MKSKRKPFNKYFQTKTRRERKTNRGGGAIDL